MARLPELHLLVNISIKGCQCNTAVVRIGLAMCERRKDKYIKSRKFDMSTPMSYFSRFTLKISK